MNLKKMKLAQKLGIIISALLIFIFSILVLFSMFATKGAMQASIKSEFEKTAKINASQVEEIIFSANSAASNLCEYFNTTYATAQTHYLYELEEDDLPPTIESKIYNVPMSEMHADIEWYLMSTMSAFINSDPNIVGMGAYFEKNKFDENIEDYAIYTNLQTAKSGMSQHLNSYAEYSQNEYYIVPKTTNKPHMTKPYVDNGIKMVTISYPVNLNGEFIGIVMADIDIKEFSNVQFSNSKYPTMFATLFAQDGTIVYDSEGEQNVGKLLSDFYVNNPKEFAKMESGFKGDVPFSLETLRDDGRTITRFFYPIKAGSDNWWTLTALDTDDMNKDVAKITLWLIGISVVSLIVVVLVTVLILKKMLKPIKGVVEAANNIAIGNFDFNIESKSEDELGILAKTFAGASNNLKTIISDIGYLLGEMAQGNFVVNTENEESYVGSYHQILLSMLNIKSNLSDTLLQINESASQVFSGSEQVSSGAQALSQGATEQAASIEELSATINEIAIQIKSTAENSSDANKLVMEASSSLELSSTQMNDMINAMREISATSNEIGKIIKTIDDIAFQTNILALNAAVEAARAGEAGKGFAVVADEVRNLASKSAEAAKNTTVLIESAVNSVNKGSSIADITAKSLVTVVDNASRVGVIVEQIAKASDEQANAVTQVTLGIDQISSVVQTNSATAEESAAASEELSGQAQMLNDLVGHFKLDEKSSEDFSFDSPVNNDFSLDENFSSLSDKY